MCAPVKLLRNKTAQELLEFCGQDQSIPVDLNAILNKVGISALPRSFSDLEAVIKEENEGIKDFRILGAIVMNGDKAAIFYNENDRKDGHRCRFTIAHELAHCCLSHTVLHNTAAHIDFRIEGKEELIDDEEKAANIFAGELLIPYEMLIKVMDELLLPSVRVLADVFDVSDSVMLGRLRHLGISRNISGYNY